MEKIVVISFEEHEKIATRIHNLKELEKSGEVMINEFITVHKTAHGELVYKTNNSQESDGFTIGGAIIGGVFGLFGGPLGVAVGAGLGGVIGEAIDHHEQKHEDKLLNEIMHTIPDKTISIIAYVFEYTTGVIKQAFHSKHAKVFEYDMDGDWFEYSKADLDEVNNSLVDLQKRIDGASEHEKGAFKLDYQRLKNEQHHLIQRENKMLRIRNKHLCKVIKKSA